MKISYKTNKLEKQLSSAKEIKKAFGVNAAKVQQRIDEIVSSDSLAVLLQIRSAHCHPLTGTRKGEWAVNISNNHRMLFVLDHDPLPVDEYGNIKTLEITDISLIETGDYH